MLEVLTATGLASAAGLNAGLPLLLLGAAARWTPLVELPVGWTWLSDGWLLIGLAVLVVLDVAADKVPGLDSLNDLVQSVVRPASGGLAFGAGIGATTVAVAEPSALSATGVVLPVALGVALALVVHLVKAFARPVVNASTLGAGGPVVSVAEDVTALALSLAALLAPAFAAVLLVAGAIGLVRLGRRRQRRPRRARTTTGPPEPP